MINFPLRPSGTSPSKLGGGCDFSRSTNLLGELREAVRGCLQHAQSLTPPASE